MIRVTAAGAVLVALVFAPAAASATGIVAYEGFIEDGLHVVDVATGSNSLVVPARFPGPDVIYAQWPSLSPDGSSLAFQQHYPPEPGTQRICVTPATRRAERCLTHGHDDLAPSWSPDGRRVAFLRPGPRGATLRVIPARGGPDRVVASVATVRTGPRTFLLVGSLSRSPWSPGGERIVYASAGDLYVVWLATGRVKRLTSSEAVDSDASWSPDGKRIAWLREGNIHVMRTSGLEKTRVTYLNARPKGPPTWSSNGRLAFSAGSALYVTTTGHVRPRATAGGFSVNGNPVWAPDGRSLAFLGTSVTAPRRPALWTVDGDGDARRLAGVSPPGTGAYLDWR